jgi:chromosomal replication initiator protein
VVAKHYGLRSSELRGKNNSTIIVLPRQVVMYLAGTMGNHSAAQIGRYFNKHHTTVLHAANKITELRKLDAELNRVISMLAETIVSATPPNHA